MSAPPVVHELVSRFRERSKELKSGQYNETQLRREFLDPFFKALGWDIDNSQGAPEAYKDVVHEDVIKIAGRSKAPDYSFRIGGVRKFFLEAKKPALNLREDPSPAFQLRRYAWSAHLPISVLSDFEEFVVYDCRVRPTKTDKSSTARYLYLSCDDYDSKWEELEHLFSRESVLRGVLDDLLDTAGEKKGTATVDDAFLSDIENWRRLLAQNIATRNRSLSQVEVNFAVQKTIDRIIFLRICESRGIETSLTLQSLMNGGNIYTRMLEHYRQADDKYNSGLFHFREEKDRAEAPDRLSMRLAIDDSPLKSIIGGLYYPESPYEFSVLPADILGHVYEQFLGKVVRLTKGHHAVVEDKPEIKKAGGVYYTPTYIVDFIVRHTVGVLVKNMSPAQVIRLRILDPSCGSGSFLIGVYQFLLDWYRDYYVANGPDKHKKVLYQVSGGVWRLTTSERKRILLKNIYGVDVDSQAVEVAKLSLLLKVLEGESEESINRQLRLFHERALPDLGENIICGNSLIGSDYIKPTLFPDPAVGGTNVFDWDVAFPKVLAQGGFDTIIGNPPWGADFEAEELAYLRKRHKEAVARTVDSYIYFESKALSLAKKRQYVGFIVPGTILNQTDVTPLRRILLKRGLSAVLNLGKEIFTRKVLNTSAIVISGPEESRGKILVGDFSRLPLVERKGALASPREVPRKEWERQVFADPHATFFVGQDRGPAILNRLRANLGVVSDVVPDGIQRGVTPDVVDAHVVPVDDVAREKLESGILKKSIGGSQIKSYEPWMVDQYIIYATRKTDISKYPQVMSRLRRFRSKITCKEVKRGKHPWWALHRGRDAAIFQSPKFIGLTTSKKIEILFDSEDSLFVTDAMYVFRVNPDWDPWAVLAIMQSDCFLFLYRLANFGETRVIPQVKASKLETLPFPVKKVRHLLVRELAQLARSMSELKKGIAQDKTGQLHGGLDTQVRALHHVMEQKVSELYGLTSEEMEVLSGE